ncbi:DMT family transporter [uncultured Clostridium sp.]|uniref:DMT family transporter n=1 Tax=uncultured Clostridium sp. TaxID=59620 RepID=UPI00258813DD|nr:DMT family transporter [uncultured Clostridium sp.]
MFYFYILLAVLAGVSVVISRIFNSIIAEEIGTLQGTFINYFTGLVTSFVLLLITKDYVNIDLNNYYTIPIYSYFGGIIGILVVVLSNYTIPRVSSFSLSLLVFIGQLSIGIFIDYFSNNGVSKSKIIGGVFILIGLSYNMLLDKNNYLESISEN